MREYLAVWRHDDMNEECASYDAEAKNLDDFIKGLFLYEKTGVICAKKHDLHVFILPKGMPT